MTAATHRWQAQSPEGAPPDPHIINFVLALKAPARPMPAAQAHLRPAGFYWVRHAPEALPPGADTIARWNGRWWSPFGAISRWDPKDVTVLSDRIEQPKPQHERVLSDETRGGLLRAALVGISTAWPLSLATWLRLPLGFKSYVEPQREPPRDEAFASTERD